MLKGLITLLAAFLLVFACGVWFFAGDPAEHDGGRDPSTLSDAVNPGYPAVFDHFADEWNRSTSRWLVREREAVEAQIAALNQGDKQTENGRAEMLADTKLSLLEAELEDISRAQSDGPAILERTPSDLPAGLVWQNGMDEPDLGDPAAVKGGHVTLWNPADFPSTLRRFGSNSKNYFNYSLYDNVDMKLVGIHPATGRIIPALASEWAIDPDGRTVYYKLHPEARYSDGLPVRAADYLLNICLRTSRYASDGYYLNFFRKQCSAVRTYGERIIAITIPRAKPFLPYMAAEEFYPANPVFYRDFDASFLNKYQWKAAPTTGGYTVFSSDIIRGRAITMRRVKNWWAAHLKYYRYTCNVDGITHQFISDENRGIELFKQGSIDILTVHKPEIWNEKLEIAPVLNGYIHKTTLETEYPRPAYGLYINTAKAPLNDLNVRLGIGHAMNMGLVLQRLFHGDMNRLDSYASGYGPLTNPAIRARDYSPGLARRYFAAAGYTIQGPDGILRNDKGEKLRIELTYADMSTLIGGMAKLLKQYALSCGLEIGMDPLESSVCSRKVFEKRHQMVFWAWPMPYPLPQLSRMFHSSTAYDNAGRLIAYTDNICSIADLELDHLLLGERRAETIETFREATWAVQHRFHDLAAWVPGWKESGVRVAYWRWIKWPDTPQTRFCYPAIYDPIESHLYWIDGQTREETLKASSNNAVLPVHDVLIGNSPAY